MAHKRATAVRGDGRAAGSDPVVKINALILRALSMVRSIGFDPRDDGVLAQQIEADLLAIAKLARHIRS